MRQGPVKGVLLNALFIIWPGPPWRWHWSRLVDIDGDLSPGIARETISLNSRELTASRHWWTLLHLGSVLILAYLMISDIINVVLGPDPRPSTSGRMDTLGDQTELVHALPETCHKLSLVLPLKQRGFQTRHRMKISVILGWSLCSS